MIKVLSQDAQDVRGAFRRNVLKAGLMAAAIAVGVYGCLAARGVPKQKSLALLILDLALEHGLGGALGSALAARGVGIAASPSEDRWLLGRHVVRGICSDDGGSLLEKLLWLEVAQNGLLLDPADVEWWQEPYIWLQRDRVRAAAVSLIAAHARRGLLGVAWRPVVTTAIDACNNSPEEQSALVDLCLSISIGVHGDNVIVAALTSDNSDLRRHAIASCVRARTMPSSQPWPSDANICVMLLRSCLNAGSSLGVREDLNNMGMTALDVDDLARCIDCYRSMVAGISSIELAGQVAQLGPLVSRMMDLEASGPKLDVRFMAIAMMITVCLQLIEEKVWRDGGWADRLVQEWNSSIGAAHQ